jgi:acyl-CoA dehydrogenase
VEAIKAMLAQASPSPDQVKDTDFLLTLGEAFTQVVYAQLVLENADIYSIEPELVDQIFDFMVRDFSGFALKLYSQPTTTPDQCEFCLRMILRPDVNPGRFNQVWSNHVYSLKDEYEMNP